MGFHKSLRERMFKTKRQPSQCTAETCLKAFVRDQENVKLPQDGKVALKWNPKESKVEYVMYYGLEMSRSMVREFEGITSEMMADFLRELRGRYPKLQITNTVIL